MTNRRTTIKKMNTRMKFNNKDEEMLEKCRAIKTKHTK